MTSANPRGRLICVAGDLLAVCDLLAEIDPPFAGGACAPLAASHRSRYKWRQRQKRCRFEDFESSAELFLRCSWAWLGPAHLDRSRLSRAHRTTRRWQRFYGTLAFSGAEIFRALAVQGGASTKHVGTFTTSGATLSTETMLCDSDAGSTSLSYAYTVAGQEIITRFSPDPIVMTWTLAPTW